MVNGRKPDGWSQLLADGEGDWRLRNGDAAAAVRVFDHVDAVVTRVRAKTPKCFQGVPSSIDRLALTPLTGSAPLVSLSPQGEGLNLSGHGTRATPDHESTRAVAGFPHPGPLPQGEGDQGVRFATFMVTALA